MDIDRITKNKLSELNINEVSSCYKTCFNTAEGRLVLEDLRRRAFIDMPSFDEVSAIDTSRVLVNEGKRSVLLHIQTMLTMELTDEPIRSEDD